MRSPEAPVAWHLPALLARRRFSTHAQLRAALRHAGYEISLTHVGRLVSERPERLSMRLLDALCRVLHCQISDLLELDPPLAAPARPTTPQLSPAQYAATAGPPLRALPTHRLARPRGGQP